MAKRIVFQLPGQPVSVLIPCDCGLDLDQIGTKDVPAGLPFWIVDSRFIPSTREYREAWHLDFASMGNPSGVGGEK